MIDASLPLDQLPVYLHPVTGAPWFACAQCASHHVRPRALQTREFGMNAVVTTRDARHYVGVPGSDRALDLEFGRAYDEQDVFGWLECGDCGAAFSADGAALDLTAVRSHWHVVDNAEVAAEVAAATGLVLHEGLDPETDAALYTLRNAEPGARVGTWLLEMLIVDGPWLDEPFADDTSGIHVHPACLPAGVPDWAPPYTDACEWPAESLMEHRPGVPVAYIFFLDSLPTYLNGS